MSSRAKILQKLYRQGKVTLEGLRQAIEDGVIPAGEFEQITGEPWEKG